MVTDGQPDAISVSGRGVNFTNGPGSEMLWARRARDTIIVATAILAPAHAGRQRCSVRGAGVGGARGRLVPAAHTRSGGGRQLRRSGGRGPVHRSQLVYGRL